jgi:anaerobic selenocysteine-containing dehydrogenase
MLPESETTIKALSSRDFVVVVDSFLTDTARLAHLVLPTTTLLEADDLLGSYGHHWIGVAKPVVEPPEGVKSDLEIAQELAKRVGLAEVMAGTTSDWKRRFIAPKLAPHGITLETLEAGVVRNPLPKKVLFADRKRQSESPDRRAAKLCGQSRFSAVHDVSFHREVSVVTLGNSAGRASDRHGASGCSRRY